MDDRELLEEHALARDRLRGSLLEGTGWREQVRPGTARRVLAGAVVGVLAAAIVAAASFVGGQLHAAAPAGVQRTTDHAQE